MRPDDRELDDEIRGHLAISVQERIERGEDPEAARLAALREFGYIPAARDSMRRVWHSRYADAAAALGRDLRIAVRSLRRAKGLTVAVVATLALGVGRQCGDLQRRARRAPAAARQSRRRIASSISGRARPASGPRTRRSRSPRSPILEARLTTIRGFGDFSTAEFTILGLGEGPRVVKAGVVNGAFFGAMGLRPVLGRLLDAGRRWSGRGGCGRADASLLDERLQRRSGGRRPQHPPRARARRPSSACWSRRCRIRPTPRSSPTW